MQITRQADYAIRAMLYIAKLKPNERASTSNIAKAQQIPSSFLAKIISQLSISGLLHTSRGAKEEAFPVREWAPEGLQLGEEGGVAGIRRGFHGLVRSLAGFNQMGRRAERLKS
jgi:hypothetical protein